MRKWLLLLAFIPSLSFSANHLTGFWAADGVKLPRDFFYDHGATSSTTTINRLWDGKTITPFSAQGQTVSFEVFALNNSGVDASSVTVSMSSMTCANSTGIQSVVVSSLNVTDISQRPIQVFSAWYVQNKGLSIFPFGFGEYEERMYPVDMRLPCTLNTNKNQCSTTQDLKLWSSRVYRDVYLPIAWVPEEEFLISSETVKAGNSKSFDVDVWVSTNIPAGQCTGTFTVFEGPNISTAIPVNMKVYGLQLPTNPGFLDTVWVSEPDVDLRLNGNRFPSPPPTGSFLTGRNNVSKLLKAHNMTIVGDQVDSSANDFPSAEFESHYSTNSPNAGGLLYTAANGYGNARGANLPDPVYGIGIYGTWQSANWSTTTTSGSSGFCTNVSSWTAYCQKRGITCFLYTPLDETSAFNLNHEINTLSTWMSTAPACAFNGHTMAMMQTGDLPPVASSAPFVGFPTSTQYFDDFAPLPSQWQVIASSIMAGNGPFGSGGQVWTYNGNIFGVGDSFVYEDEGYVPESNYWAYWKKLCYDGKCHGGHFHYAGNLWQDDGSGGQANSGNNDLYNDPKTFGYRNYYLKWTVSGISVPPTCDYTDGNANEYNVQPTTITAGSGNFFTFNIANNVNPQTLPQPPAGAGTLTKVASTCNGSPCTCVGDTTISYSSWVVTARTDNNQWGDHSFNYAQGDGVLFYPGIDTVFHNPSFGFNGAVAGFTLKKVRDGITDMDLLNAAYAINITSTTALVQQMFPQALWEKSCFESVIGGDCSYSYGDRTWSYGADNWVMARERLMEIATGPADHPATIPGNEALTGTILIFGNVKLR